MNQSKNKNKILFSTVIGMGVGAICGVAATALYDTLSMSVIEKSLRIPNINRILKNSVITSSISTLIFGYQGYNDAVKKALADKGHAHVAKEDHEVAPAGHVLLTQTTGPNLGGLGSF